MLHYTSAPHSVVLTAVYLDLNEDDTCIDDSDDVWTPRGKGTLSPEKLFFCNATVGLLNR